MCTWAYTSKRVKVFIGHYTLYNVICRLHLTHPSMPLGQPVRSSGQLRGAVAGDIQMWSQANGQIHLLEDLLKVHVIG